MHFLTWNVSLFAIDWNMHNLCLLAVLDTASAIYESGAQGMFLWPHLMSAGLGFLGSLFGVCVCLFLMGTPSLGER